MELFCGSQLTTLLRRPKMTFLFARSPLLAGSQSHWAVVCVCVDGNHANFPSRFHLLNWKARQGGQSDKCHDTEVKFCLS